MNKISRIVLIFLLALLAAACAPPTEADVPEAPAAEAAAASEAAESAAASEPAVEPAGIPDAPLSDQGPWLVLHAVGGLYALNPDGSGLTRFEDTPGAIPYSPQFASALRGGLFAYHRSEGEQNDKAIRIVKFPALETVAEIPLFTYTDDPDMSAERAVGEYQSMAFSPDGATLAFMGVIDGPTSDLYTYSLVDGKMTRLTDGSSQGYQTGWSPDGKYILHTGADGFGTGAGFTTTGVWAAKTDTSVKPLYTPAPNNAEFILDWVDDETFVVYSWSQPCGAFNLRTFNIENREISVLWEGAFDEIAMDPASKTIVMTSRDSEFCGVADGPGVYFFPISSGSPQKVSDQSSAIVVWSPEAERFIVSGGSFEDWALGVDTNGQVSEIERPVDGYHLPVAAPRSNYLFWIASSPHISTLDDSMPMTAYFDESIQRAIWTPDGGAVIFAADSGLYIAYPPDFEAILISPDVGVSRYDAFIAWLNP